MTLYILRRRREVYDISNGMTLFINHVLYKVCVALIEIELVKLFIEQQIDSILWVCAKLVTVSMAINPMISV